MPTPNTLPPSLYILRGLLDHPERRAAVIEAGRAHVLRSFSLVPVRTRVAARLQRIGLLARRAG